MPACDSKLRFNYKCQTDLDFVISNCAKIDMHVNYFLFFRNSAEVLQRFSSSKKFIEFRFVNSLNHIKMSFNNDIKKYFFSIQNFFRMCLKNKCMKVFKD